MILLMNVKLKKWINKECNQWLALKIGRGEILPPFFLAFYVILKLKKRLGAKMKNIIELKSIKKGYIVKKRSLLVLDDLSVSFEKGKCVIVVSHSDEVKKYADKLYELDDRNIVEVK